MATEQKDVFHQVLVARELGGAGLVAMQISRYLNVHGLESPVWAPGEGPALDEARSNGLVTHTYDAESAFHGGRLRGAIANFRLARRLRRGRGLVHVHGPLHYGALHLGLRLCGLKRVVHVQIEEAVEGLRWAFQKPPELIVTCARFLVDHVRQTLPEHLQNTQRIEAVCNGVDTERFSPANDKSAAKRHVGALEHAPLVLMLANLSPHKGQETTLRAVAALRERGITVHCWLAGTERFGQTSYTAELRRLIEQLGIHDCVQLLGYRADAPDLLRAADFCLLPSTCEGLPLALLEAQATKVATLAAPTAGIPEIIAHGTTGFLIAADDAPGYAHWIETLLGNRQLYTDVTERACGLVNQNYSWQAYCRRMWRLYQELLAGQNGRVAGDNPGRPEEHSPYTLSHA